MATRSHPFGRSGLTAAEAAEIICCTRDHVYALVSDGRLPKHLKHEKAGLRLEDIEAYSLARWRPSRPNPYWATAPEAQALLGLSKSRVQQLCDTGALPAVKAPCGWWLFRREQLEVIASAWEARRSRCGRPAGSVA